MKKCDNCNAIIRDNDKYCRNCGILLPSKLNKLIYNLFLIIIILNIIFVISLFLVSYFVEWKGWKNGKREKYIQWDCRRHL